MSTAELLADGSLTVGIADTEVELRLVSSAGNLVNPFFLSSSPSPPALLILSCFSPYRNGPAFLR